jgi:hypothetical protein
LQKLKEQQATFGLQSPPHILIEIEDIETKIETLQTELAVLDSKEIYHDKQRPDPDEAKKLVETLPTDKIPEVADISRRSKMPPRMYKDHFVDREDELKNLAAVRRGLLDQFL